MNHATMNSHMFSTAASIGGTFCTSTTQPTGLRRRFPLIAGVMGVKCLPFRRVKPVTSDETEEATQAAE